jgi:hypothetical protein
MSIVLGVYIHVHQGRHRLVWTLVDGDTIVEQGDLGSATTSEADRLAEFDVRLSDLLDRLARGPKPLAGIALRAHDVRVVGSDESIRIPAHAEGVVLAVAGRKHLKVVSVSGQRLGGRQVVAARTGALQPAPADQNTAQAAAAALKAAPEIP